MDTPAKKCKIIVGESPKLVFMFEFEKNNFSAIEKHASSHKFKVGGLSWQLIIDRNVNENSNLEVLSVYLCCEGKSKLWCCYARIRLTIISQKDGVEDHSEMFESLFSSLKDNRGIDLMGWDDVVDPSKGYIKNDTIKIQVYVTADAPQNVDADFKKECPLVFDDWMSTFENEINEKIIRRVSEELKETNALIRRELNNVTVLKHDWKTIIDNAFEPINTRINSIEQNLEKSCQDHLTRIIEKLKYEKTMETEDTGNENKDDGNCDKKRKNQNVQAEDTKKAKIISAQESVLREMSKSFHRPLRSPCLFGCRNSSRFHELCSYNPEHESQSYNLSYGGFYPSLSERSPVFVPVYRQFENLTEKKCLQLKEENINSDSSVIPNQTLKNEDCLVKEETNWIDFTITTSDSSKLKLEKPSILSEEEAVASNIDLEKPIENEKLLFIGENSNGEVITQKITCLKELFELKKKYNSHQILEIKTDK